MLPVVRATIEAWYKKLAFPAEYDTEFYTYLDTVEIDPNVTAETYEEDADGAKNFLTCLYCCEQLKRRYEEKGIDPSILYASLQELWLWTRSRTNRAGKLWLADLWWVKKNADDEAVSPRSAEFLYGRRGTRPARTRSAERHADS